MLTSYHSAPISKTHNPNNQPSKIQEEMIMHVLYSRLDALVFDFVSFGIFTIVNNLWTWVAVITAAVSFWGIRAGGAGPMKLESPSSALIESDIANELPESEFETELLCPAPASSAPSSVAPSVFEDNGVTKGRFVTYYGNDRQGDADGDGRGFGELTVFGDWGLSSCGGDGRGEWWGSWERILRVRMGDNGWYSYQDLTAINGNVVRLWEGVRGEK